MPAPRIPRLRGGTDYQHMPDAGYDPRVTDLSHPLNMGRIAGAGLPGSGSGAAARRYYNKNVSTLTPVQLTANVSLRILPYNDRRSGLQIVNKDPAAPLNYSFGNDAGVNGLQLAAGGMALYDFTTPPDTLYLLAAADILVAILEISRMD